MCLDSSLQGFEVRILCSRWNCETLILDESRRAPDTISTWPWLEVHLKKPTEKLHKRPQTS